MKPDNPLSRETFTRNSSHIMTKTMRLIAIIALAAVPLGAQDSVKKETPPAPGTPKNFKVPPRRNFTLPNGLQVTLVEAVGPARTEA